LLDDLFLEDTNEKPRKEEASDETPLDADEEVTKTSGIFEYIAAVAGKPVRKSGKSVHPLLKVGKSWLTLRRRRTNLIDFLCHF
jgi:hypothetical protein